MKLFDPIFKLKRRAKLLSRELNLPLNATLDRVAREEGFASWSLLAARDAAIRPAGRMFARLVPGDMVLLGARPGHGKTLLGLELILEAVKAGQKGTFYTLEYQEEDVVRRLGSLGVDPAKLGDALAIVTSDAISADFIMAHAQSALRGSVAVIDYLQILNQDRRKPDLASQIAALKSFAQETGVIFIFISQIDRSFNPDLRPVPEIADLRLPNPIDLTLFSKACFTHDGAMRFTALG